MQGCGREGPVLNGPWSPFAAVAPRVSYIHDTSSTEIIRGQGKENSRETTDVAD